MSTTDTRCTDFEAWAIKENYAFYSESERRVLFYGVSGTRNAIQKAWEAGIAQAATEAAKSFIHADELIGLPVSMDVSTGDDDADHRIFGKVIATMPSEDGITILAEEESRNFSEAAKATGTAGELPPLIGMEVSMDVSTGDEDFDHRIFGRIEGLMDKGDGTDIILAVEESRNFAADTQAARQPAPVVDDEAQKRVIDHITAFDKRLIGRGFDHAQRMEIVGLLVSKETQDAALAATAAPVVDIEQLIGIIRSFGYTTYSQSREIAEALAARSQP